MTFPYLQPRLPRSNRRMVKNQTNFNFGHSQKPVVIENASAAGLWLSSVGCKQKPHGLGEGPAWVRR